MGRTHLILGLIILGTLCATTSGTPSPGRHLAQEGEGAAGGDDLGTDGAEGGGGGATPRRRIGRGRRGGRGLGSANRRLRDLAGGRRRGAGGGSGEEGAEGEAMGAKLGAIGRAFRRARTNRRGTRPTIASMASSASRAGFTRALIPDSTPASPAPAAEPALGKGIPRMPGGKKVAIAVTVTQDGPYLDGAAVFYHSAMRMKSKFDIELIAIVHPKVVTTRAALVGIGFKIYEFDQPVYPKDIQMDFLRTSIEGSGCCGSSELLKLRAYQLTQYDRVLLMDMDTIIVKNIDHLFEIEGDPSLVYTKDWPMVTGKAPPPVQGGFLLIRPSEEIYQELVAIVKEGDWRPGTGWKGKVGWFYGGPTIQGLMAYYYIFVRESEGVAIDECLYNAQANSEKCKAVELEDIYTIHYTLCQKPWLCSHGVGPPLCGQMVDEWWKVRGSLEKSMGQKPTKRCAGGAHNYPQLKLEVSKDAEVP